MDADALRNRSVWYWGEMCPTRHTYRLQEAEGNQPHDKEDKVERERQERIEEGRNENDRERGAYGRGNNAVDDSAILGPVHVMESVHERGEDPEHNGGADELPDAQDHHYNFRCGAHGDCVVTYKIVDVVFEFARRS